MRFYVLLPRLASGVNFESSVQKKETRRIIWFLTKLFVMAAAIEAVAANSCAWVVLSGVTAFAEEVLYGRTSG